MRPLGAFIGSFLLMALLLLSPVLVQGVNPIQVNLQPNTCEIIYPKFNNIPINSPFAFHIHVHNATGMLMTNTTTSCMFHLYNITGKHIIESNMSFESNKIDFFYNLPQLNRSKYTILVNCNRSVGGCFLSKEFDVTRNGKDVPDGYVIIFFSALFIIMVGITIFMAIYTFGHLMNMDFDILDLAKNWGIFFAFMGFYILEKEYMQNVEMENLMNILLYTAGFLLIVVSLIAFLISIFVKNMTPEGGGRRKKHD